MQNLPDEITETLRLLEATPRRIESLIRDVAPSRLRAKPAADVWSILEVLAHLRACADVWGKTIAAMIAQDNPTLRYVSPRTWMKKTDYATQAFSDSLQAFVAQRSVLLQSLKRLDDHDWSRGATFTGTVKGRQQTVSSYARRLADHEVAHLAQIERLLKTGRDS